MKKTIFISITLIMSLLLAILTAYLYLNSNRILVEGLHLKYFSFAFIGVFFVACFYKNSEKTTVKQHILLCAVTALCTVLVIFFLNNLYHMLEWNAMFDEVNLGYMFFLKQNITYVYGIYTFRYVFYAIMAAVEYFSVFIFNKYAVKIKDWIYCVDEEDEEDEM